MAGAAPMAQPSMPSQPMGPMPGSTAPAPNPSPVTAQPVKPGFSPNAGESLGPRLSISARPNPSPVQPLPRPLNQGHVMTSSQPWLDMPHNPLGPAFQRPLEEF